jgi:hypothetical protein
MIIRPYSNNDWNLACQIFEVARPLELKRGFRRDVRECELVSYVNNIVGCYLSDNYELILVFIERARFHMMDCEANENTGFYYNKVEDFLLDMEKFLDEKYSSLKNR